MNKNDAVILEWRYTPKDFFEETIDIQRDDCEIRIADGRVTATVAPDQYNKGHKKRDELHEFVEVYFRSVQLFTHQSFAIPKPGMSRVHPDGRRDVTVFPETLHLKMKVNDVDVVVTDADGNIVTDSKRERIEAEKKLAEAIGRIGQADPILIKLLDSYRAAVEDPDDELVHLYEIRDALFAHFNCDARARSALGISYTDWKRLGKLANEEPIREGRHRGKSRVPLRKATPKELGEARNLARQLIEAYVRYTDSSLPTQ
jgi:hypothetical protein